MSNLTQIIKRNAYLESESERMAGIIGEQEAIIHMQADEIATLKTALREARDLGGELSVISAALADSQKYRTL